MAGLAGGALTPTLLDTLTGNTSPDRDSLTAYQYSLTGKVSSIRTAVTANPASDRLTTFTYNAFGENDVKFEVFDSTRTPRTEYKYDKRGQLTLTRWDSAAGGLDTSEARSYDAFGYLRTVTDARSNVVSRFEYDRLGQQTASIDSNTADRTVTSYDAFGRVFNVYDPFNRLTTYRYDEVNRRMIVTTPQNIVVTTEFNRHGQVFEVTAAGGTTTYSYDRDGQLTHVSDDRGTLESRSYDSGGRQITTTDANGVVTRFTYDAANRVLSRIEDVGGLSLTTTYTYDGLGRVTSVVEPSGRRTDTTYYRDGSIEQTVVANGSEPITTRYVYDRAGHALTVTEGYASDNPRVTEYRYDNLGRVTLQIVDPGSGYHANGLPILNITTQYFYDDNGNLTRKIDAELNSTWYVYDEDNRLTHTIDALGGVTVNKYDYEDRVIETRRIATALPTVTMNTLAGLNEVTLANFTVSETGADRTQQTVYDLDGRGRFSIDAMGGVIERTFDDNGNVTRERAYATRIPVTSYTSVSQVVIALGSAVVDTIQAEDRVQWTAYDLRGQVTFTVDALGGVIRYVYDENGNVTSKTEYARTTPTNGSMSNGDLAAWAELPVNRDDGRNRVTRYWYDATGRLRYTLDAERYLTELTYNDAGREDRRIVYANRATISAGATTQDIAARAPGVSITTDSSVDQTTTTKYDAAGRVYQIWDAYNNYEEFLYDRLGNKRSYRNQKGAVWAYIYDANGRLHEERSPLVQVTTVTGGDGSLDSNSDENVMAHIVTRMTYDDLGNVLTRTEGIQRFDDANHTEIAAGSRVTTYVYDKLGRQTRTYYTPVGVYSGGVNDIYVAGTAVVRTESTPLATDLYSEVAYDTFGNAYRNRDIAGYYSFKVYDALGRVQYEVDAENQVTGYTYDTFGNQRTLKRYATALTGSLSTTSTGLAASDVVALLSPLGSEDRELTKTYDRLNRLTQVTETAVYNYETRRNDPSVAFLAGATTLNEYDAFGHVVRSRRLVNPLLGQYADSYYYYDRMGNKTAEVDPRNFLTIYEYDETGDLTRQVEYARPVTGAVSTSSYGTVEPTTHITSPNNPNGYDRETRFTYDRLNRKRSETKYDVAYTTISGTTTTEDYGHQVTSFDYDAVGNQVKVTRNGAITYTQYDALGRATLIAAPERDRGDGVRVTPLTVLNRDVHGNLVEQIEYFNGASSIGETTHSVTADAAHDRVSRFVFDLQGRVVHSEDASGADRFASYNRRGELVKEWQPVVNNDGGTDSLVTIYEYDKVGRKTATIEPRIATGSATGSVIVTTKVKYNAFGEVILKGVVDGGPDSGQQEYFQYDQMGRIWRTNSGDGVDKIYAYNLAGNATVELKSKSVDLKTAYASASLALESATPRAETVYDVNGNVEARRETTFGVASPYQSIDATFQFGDLLTPNPPNAVYQYIQLDLGMGLGIYVLNPSPWSAGGGYYQVSPPSASNPQGTYARVAQSSYSLTEKPHIYWNAPLEPGLTKTFEYRVAGSTGAWQTLAVNPVGNSQIGVDVSNVPTNGYEYRVSYTRPGDTTPYARAEGTFTVNQSTVTTLSVSTSPAVTGIGGLALLPGSVSTTLRWVAPDASLTATLEVRLQGSNSWGAPIYATYHPAEQQGSPPIILPPMFTASFPTVGGTYEYRITHTRDGETIALSTGSLTLTAPNTTTTGSNMADAAWSFIGTVGASASSAPSGNPSVTLQWADHASPTNEFMYRLVGTTNWTYPQLSVSGGVVQVLLGALPPGTYEYYARDGQWLPYPQNHWIGNSASGQFAVTSTSATVTSQNVYQGPLLATITASVVVPPPVVTTTISWPIPSNIGGTPAFSYRPSGSSTGTTATITQSGGYNYVTLAGLSGPYEYSILYSTYNPSGQPIVTVHATANGQFTVSGASATVTSQTNYTPAGGSAAYLSGVSVSGSRLTWTAAPQPGTTITVSYTNTSTGATGTLTPQLLSGNTYTADFYGLVSGPYRYQISYVANGVEYLRGPGTLNITTNTTPASGSAGTPTTPGQIMGFADFGSSLGYLMWTTLPASGASMVFRYKAANATSWAGTLTPFAVAGGYAVNVSGLSGAIEYELSYTRANEQTPYMIGGGTTTIVRTSDTGGSTGQPGPNNPTPTTPLLTQAVDRWGNVLEIIDATRRATTSYRYNQLGQLIEQKLPEASATNTQATVSTANGRATSYNYYDLFGRLIATRDANGNLNRVTYNEADQVIVETHADDEYRNYVYDAFGQLVQVADELRFRTRNVYDKAGNLVTVAQELVNGAFTNISPFNLDTANSANILKHEYDYDEAGRRLSETSGDTMSGSSSAETTRYWYDLQGNVVKRTTPRGWATLYEYDLAGRKTRETDAIGGVSTWRYDYFGRVQDHVDLAGTDYDYVYNELGLLDLQTNNKGQNIDYQYDDAGRVTRIVENSPAAAGSGLASVNRITEYAYDVVGRRIRERVEIDGLIHQDTHIGYDDVGRVTQLSDIRYRITYRYDAVGNRTEILATYYDHGGTQQTDDLWYTYDRMNRVKISQGKNSAGVGVTNGGTIGIDTSQGISLLYDAKGQRSSARTNGTRLEVDNHYRIVYPGGGGPGPGIPVPETTYQEVSGLSTESYTYDGAGRLVQTRREAHTVNRDQTGAVIGSNDDAFLISTRTYDGASRELSDNYVTFEVSSGLLRRVDRSRVSNYDDDGRLANQTTKKNNVNESYIVYGDSTYSTGGTYYYMDPFSHVLTPYTIPASWSPGYDAAGNLRGYIVKVYNTTTSQELYTSTYRIEYRPGETYLEERQTVSSTSGGPGSGTTERKYNVNGELVQFIDNEDQTKNRYFANNVQGQALTVVQGQYDGQSNRATAHQAFQYALGTPGPYNSTKAQHFFFANGQQVGSFGQLTENGEFKANFDVNYTPVSEHYPAPSVSEVVVQMGDTLRGIAARIYGDANLWYLIAEENGLATDPGTELTPGTSLRIPNDVVSMSNAASSFKPYNAQEAIGDTTPTQPLPPPPKKKGCGVIGMILVIVVAIVVTIYTAGAAAGGANAVLAGAGGTTAGSTWAAGMAAFGVGGGLASTGTAIAAAAIGGAVGSAVSQGVGIAIGVQDEFDWKGVAMGAIGSGVSAGLGAFGTSAWGDVVSNAVGGNPYALAAINGAASSVLTQGIAVVTGLQSSFNWRNVAISSVAAPIARGFGVAAGELVPKAGDFGVQFASGLGGSLVRRAFGGKEDSATIIADAFANALGNSIVDSMKGPRSTRPTTNEPEEIQITAQYVGPDAEARNARLVNSPINIARPMHDFGSVSVIAPRIRRGEDAGLDMWYALESMRRMFNKEQQQLIDQMGDWAGQNYNTVQNLLRPSPTYVDKMASAYDALTGADPGTGLSQLGYAYGGDRWLGGQYLTGGIKSAVDFAVAGTASMLTNMLLQPDPMMATVNPEGFERLQANAAHQGDAVFSELSWAPTSLDQQRAYGYGMKTQAVASLTYGGYSLVRGGVNALSALRTEASASLDAAAVSSTLPDEALTVQLLEAAEQKPYGVPPGQSLMLRPIEIEFPAAGLSQAEQRLFSSHLAEQEWTLNRISLTAADDLELNLLNYPNVKRQVDNARKMARQYLPGSGQGLDAAHALDSVAGGYIHEFVGFRDPIQQRIGSLWRTRRDQIVPGREHRLVPVFDE
ncbi:hypothetical protein ACFPN2_34765 [Steroidobacter flavus]|uniref:LysM domain-containing protein n=1 Tax=Steroidobacter flavus TaxID=1842136 RepID=A0ABV8T6A0_9GAMM